MSNMSSGSVLDTDSLNAFINNSRDSFFLLLLTPGDDNKSINVQAANQTIDALPEVKQFTKADTGNLTNAINQYIATSELNTIYNTVDPTVSAGVAPVVSASVAPAFDPQKIIDSIIEKYKTGSFDVATAVTIINNKYTITLKTSDGSTDAADGDVKSVIELTNLLNYNIGLFNDKMSLMTGGGSSRSMKHRRRHRKKNKNTKRRSRK